MAETASELTWEQCLDRQIPLLGHRNWIVVTDSAYPLQTAAGIETICTGAPLINVLKTVLSAIDHAPHVRPLVYVDAELPYLKDEDAKGISSHRAELQTILAERVVRQLPHEEIIVRLDAAGRAFRILLLKTTLIMPYTSVFVELDCGYWSAAAEQRLRAALAA